MFAQQSAEGPEVGDEEVEDCVDEELDEEDEEKKHFPVPLLHALHE